MELVALCADGISGSASLGFLAQSGPIKPFAVTEPVEGHGVQGQVSALLEGHR